MKISTYLLAAAATATVVAAPAQAQDNYIGEIMLVGFTFCPRGTADASGQLLSISQNTALFSLYGTTYGGNGTTTFALPDLRGRSAINQGQGTGLSPVTQGQAGGTENIVLTVNQMPSHNHGARVRASNDAPSTNSPAGATFPTFPVGVNQYTQGADNLAMENNEVQISSTGGDQPTSIRNPYLALRYCVVTEGIFPSRP